MRFLRKKKTWEGVRTVCALLTATANIVTLLIVIGILHVTTR